jgi:hypothetical protein
MTRTTGRLALAEASASADSHFSLVFGRATPMSWHLLALCSQCGQTDCQPDQGFPCPNDGRGQGHAKVINRLSHKLVSRPFCQRLVLAHGQDGLPGDNYDDTDTTLFVALHAAQE